MQARTPTDLFAVLFCFESNDLQDARVRDVRDDVRDAFPNPEQSAAQHVILSETHPQQTLLSLLDQLTRTLPLVRIHMLHYIVYKPGHLFGELIHAFQHT